MVPTEAVYRNKIYMNRLSVGAASMAKRGLNDFHLRDRVLIFWLPWMFFLMGNDPIHAVALM